MSKFNKITNKAAVLTLIGALALGATACGASSDKKESTTTQSNTEASSDEVRVINVAYRQDYPPYDFIDENGNPEGYEVAVLKAVDELLPEYEFSFQATTDDDILIGTESGKYQIGVKGIWWTAAREESYLFPEHYIGTSIVGFTIRTSDVDLYTDIDAFAANHGALVPLAPQNAQYTIIENYNKNHPDSQIDLIAADAFNNSDQYQWVLEGRYDAAFDIKTLFEANTAPTGEYSDLADKLTFVTYEAIPTWTLINRNEQALADAYDRAWEILNENGTLEQLQQQYFGYSLFENVPEGYQKGDEL